MAILDFTDVKNMTEGREGEGRREGGKGTRLGFLCGLATIPSPAGLTQIPQ